MEYDVERWDDDELVARSNALCVSDVLTINRARQSAVLVRGSCNESNGACRMLRAKSDDAVLRLIDGPAVAESLDVEALNFVRLGLRAAAVVKRMRAIRNHR